MRKLLLSTAFGLALAAASSAAGSASARQDARPLSAASWRLLEAHNVERRRVGAPPLAWSDDLARSAQVWAQRLIGRDYLQHDPNAGAGENLWAGWGRAYTPEEMVWGWIAEKTDYRPGVFPDVTKSGDWSDVGHYTQLIWRTTTHVGCAIADRDDRSVLVCRYSPAGNRVGDRP